MESEHIQHETRSSAPRSEARNSIKTVLIPNVGDASEEKENSHMCRCIDFQAELAVGREQTPEWNSIEDAASFPPPGHLCAKMERKRTRDN
jgi:hypothetical protein